MQETLANHSLSFEPHPSFLHVVPPIRCIGEYADLLASPQPALPALDGGAAACVARDALPQEEV